MAKTTKKKTAKKVAPKPAPAAAGPGTAFNPLLLSNRELAEFCGRRHPSYDDKCGHWHFLESTYESGREWFADNIFQFHREGEKTHQGRVQRAYRFNHTREVVDLVNKYLFKQEPIRSEDAPSYVQDFRKHTTKLNLSLPDFERQVAQKASLFGRCWAVVDTTMPALTVPLSKREAKEAGVRIYAYLVTPKDVMDIAYDDQGCIEWILIREYVRDDSDPFKSTGSLLTYYRLWTKTDWYLFQYDGENSATFEDSGVHELGIVPVAQCDHQITDRKYFAPGLIEDIAYLDRATANYLSNLDQIINDQTFSQLIMPAQGLLGAGSAPSPNAADSTGEKLFDDTLRRALKLGMSQVVLYDGEHQGKPEYISPDPRQATLIITAIKQIINEIYHTVGLAGERTKNDNSMGIDNSSGVAKAYDFERVNALLASKANAQQAFVAKLETIVRLYNGETIAAAESAPQPVKYSMNFDVRSLADEIEIATQMSLLALPMEIRRDQAQVLVDKLWPLMDDAKRAKFATALASWDDPLMVAASLNSATPTKDAITGSRGGTAVTGGAGQPKAQPQNSKK